MVSAKARQRAAPESPAMATFGDLRRHLQWQCSLYTVGLAAQAGLLVILMTAGLRGWPIFACAALLLSLTHLCVHLARARLLHLRKDLLARQWYRVDWRRMRPGDVIATRSASVLSRRIRQSIGCDFSHVALALGGSRLAEAVFPRARITKAPDDCVTSSRADLAVFRHRRHVRLDPAKLEAEAGFQSWNLYSFAKALSISYPTAMRGAARDAVICSEFVGIVYQRAGIDLHRGTGVLTPADICSGSDFTRVDHKVVRPLPRGEVAGIVDELLQSGFPRLRIPFLHSMAPLLRAMAYAVSPLRTGWRKPMSRWNRAEFAAFYAYSWTGGALGRIRLAFVRLLHDTPLRRLFESTVSRLTRAEFDELLTNARSALASLERDLTEGRRERQHFLEVETAWTPRFVALTDRTLVTLQSMIDRQAALCADLERRRVDGSK